ncbi:hypothetical protein BH24ACT3_BH24ACT3_16140 [soil metagenome]
MGHAAARPSPDPPDDVTPRPVDPLLLVRTVPEGPDRRPVLGLVATWGLGGDLAGAAVDCGHLFVFADAADDRARAVGAAHVAPIDDATTAGTGPGLELRWLAVDPSHRGVGHGRRLLSELCDGLRAGGSLRLVAALGNLDLDTMGRFQRLGFRFAAVSPVSAATARGWPPAPGSVDLVWFDLEL